MNLIRAIIILGFLRLILKLFFEDIKPTILLPSILMNINKFEY